MNENASALLICSQCSDEFQPQPHSLFLFDERTPIYCESCRAAVSEKFVSMLASRLDESTELTIKQEMSGSN